jgi:hypothetical protein
MKRLGRPPKSGRGHYPPVSPWVERYEAYVGQLRHIETLWELVSKPIKFPSPARRRREDREIPKAA